MSLHWLLIIAAASTLIAGILHLTLVSNTLNRNMPIGVFFLVAGIIQIFWFVPTIMNWHKVWFYVGIAGTLILMGMWVVTRMPDNAITGRAAPINNVGIATEVFQVIYIVTGAITIVRDRNNPPISKHQVKDSK